MMINDKGITQQMLTMRDELIAQVAERLDMHPNAIMSRRREARTTMARHIVMWSLYKATEASTTQIGAMMGRDHASVVYAIGEVYNNMTMPYHKQLREILTEISEKYIFDYETQERN
jgi:chromosomal replication initiation ATPase DnaA